MEFSLKPYGFLAKKTKHFYLPHTYSDSVIDAGIRYSDTKNDELTFFHLMTSMAEFTKA